MEPLDTELNKMSFSDNSVTSHLFSNYFRIHVIDIFGTQFTIIFGYNVVRAKETNKRH